MGGGGKIDLCLGVHKSPRFAFCQRDFGSFCARQVTPVAIGMVAINRQFQFTIETLPDTKPNPGYCLFIKLMITSLDKGRDGNGKELLHIMKNYPNEIKIY